MCRAWSRRKPRCCHSCSLRTRDPAVAAMMQCPLPGHQTPPHFSSKICRVLMSRHRPCWPIKLLPSRGKLCRFSFLCLLKWSCTVASTTVVMMMMMIVLFVCMFCMYRFSLWLYVKVCACHALIKATYLLTYLHLYNAHLH